MHAHLRFLRTTLLCFCLAVLALLPTSAAAQDGDSDGLPDSLELSLAQYYFPILNLHCGSFDGLNQADPRQLYGLTVPGYTNSSNGRIPFIAHPYSPGDGYNCTEAMQCIEIRYGIAWNWDLGDDTFGGAHRGDSETYAILVARKDTDGADWGVSWWRSRFAGRTWKASPRSGWRPSGARRRFRSTSRSALNGSMWRRAAS